jgi:alpha-galactosidase
MNKVFLVILMISFIVPSRLTHAQKYPYLASTPPMGWNSFDAFDCRISEGQFRKTVDFIAENLLQFGWNYAVIDYIWWHPSPGDWKNPKMRYGHPNIRYAPDGKPLDPTTIDKNGRLLPTVERFPLAAGGNGFKPLADYCM